MQGRVAPHLEGNGEHEERVRVVTRLTAENREPETVRRLEVIKSNSLFPAPLGMRLGAAGNEYTADDVPPPPEPGVATDTPPSPPAPPPPIHSAS